jgi:5'(3')-deoxyribonucleotidase
VGTDYLIDDNVRNLEMLLGEGILFDAHHNRAETRFRRVRDWNEVREFFAGILSLTPAIVST